ncbi:putative ATP binding protein [Tripterygium wilfordii]|uniref:non-specific serine/threonine protein kinase n=2 Tax=Tripterygium wilfordii TaxID=458696 RepID=A0A7J7CA32_TRIWF|nr:putative ATP binding protein [Tripterygium wilfordii]
MKIGKNLTSGHETFLTSWNSNEDPGRGQFSLRMDLRGFPQMFLWNGSAAHYRLGSWNGLHFTGTPELPTTNLAVCNYQFEMSRNEVYYKCVRSGVYVSRLVINELGFVERFIRTQTNAWVRIYEAPRDDCDYYNVCGADGICNVVNNSSSCDCMEGFVPKNVQEWGRKNWSGGCVRESPVDCQRKDGFQRQTGLKLPDTSGSWFNTSMSLEECKEACFRNCSCIAYATSDIKTGLGCLVWSSELLDMRRFDGGQDIYIRMGTSKPGMNKKTLVGIIVCSVVLGFLIVGLLVCIRQYKLRKKGEKDVMDLPIFGLAAIAKATDNFSIDNKLGQGGFGPVYKGTWIDGQEIAVKKLSKSSGQGLTEFKNEVILIAKLQHRNLVRLLGCCIEGEEKLLVYEYMPNKSLDFFIFDQIKGNLLDWQKRLHIIDGIARGLLYLHQDSRLRIIHRDLKASNVLLDKDMNPKISDFGLARMVGVDETEANTNRVVGTFGYMSPEYAVDGLFSVKSDVFSFGVLLLEIVSGKKNRGFSHPDHNHNLLGHAWRLWIEEKSLELTDSTLGDSFVHSEVLRCIHVGLLCVQQRPEDRPNMSAVVLMLNSETSLPNPKQPGFFTERNMPEAETSSSCSKNELSITALEPR